MLKRFALISYLVATLVPTLAWAQSHPFETLRGLERFDKSSTLSAQSSSQTTDTLLSIKGVKIGDNVLQQAVKLAGQRGKLGRIRGGTRSEKIKLSHLIIISY